jgi:hypothetical protein
MARLRRLALTVLVGVLVTLPTAGNAFAVGFVLTAKPIPIVA